MPPVSDDLGRATGAGPAEPEDHEWEGRVHRALAAIPDRLRPPLAWLTRRWFVRMLARTTAGVVRVQIFDRAMTLAAQAFTSIFPVLILLAAVLGPGSGDDLADAAGLPDTTRRVLHEALRHGGPSTFGVVGALIVLVSSTGLARALTRAYAAVWSVRRTPSGPRALWRWLATVLALTGFAVCTRLTGWLTHGLPVPHLSAAVLSLIADSAIAVAVPWLLLGGGAPARPLVAGGVLFGAAMLVVRPVGSAYLPRALATSAERYGAIGVAFTYIGWLYVVAFCVLLTAILSQVLALEEGLAGRVVRGRSCDREEAARPTIHDG